MNVDASSIIGWVAVLLVLFGFYLNASKQHTLALITWVVGDVMWIVFDTIKGIYPHLTLSSIIILINLYGLYRQKNDIS